jgi:uncharacterized protein
MIKGQLISGSYGRLLMREKAGQKVEIGELLVVEDGQKMILQAFDILYGSQIPQASLELMSGIRLEEDSNLGLYDFDLRAYNLVMLKNLLTVEHDRATICKSLPKFFSTVREITKDDLLFQTKPDKALALGKLRSGSRVVDVDIYLPGDKVLSEHILIAATTGRGKSNLTSCMLWDLADKEYCGTLVLDPHDEYFGRNGHGLKEHPTGKVEYYTPKNPPPGGKTLKLNIADIRPQHFNGVLNWSDAQKEALYAFYRKYGPSWIEAIASDEKLDAFQDGTLGVVKRRITGMLGIHSGNGKISYDGVFDSAAGKSTISDICRELEAGRTVIIDTSSFSGHVEILIGSMISTEILDMYRRHKAQGILKDKPVISIVLEEAPRVLGKEVLERGSNIFGTIAREGRKFKVGLIAITQLPSLIPRQVLANLNTKIILGLEMAPERDAIIDSASQDLSDYGRSIASLDKGEAIISSNFTKFAVPIKVPLYEKLIEKTTNEHVRQKYIRSTPGIGD